jgi:hypothetical protein
VFFGDCYPLAADFSDDSIPALFELLNHPMLARADFGQSRDATQDEQW